MTTVRFQITARRILRAVVLLLALASLLQGRGTWGDGQTSKDEAALLDRRGSHVGNDPAAKDQWLVVPGQRIGLLKLGDSREHAMELFPPKPNIDEETQYANFSQCGTEYHWLDLASPTFQSIFIQFGEGRVFQIAATDLRHHTKEGLKVRSTPEDVRHYYKDLSAYVLFGTGSRANGDRPLVYWLDRHKGVAFEFSYNRHLHKRLLGGIVVFQPNGNFCPEGQTTAPPDWQELPPSTLEPPQEMEQKWKNRFQ